MWGQMIHCPHQLGIECHVSNEKTYRRCALKSGDIHNAPPNCSGRVEGKVGV